LKAEGFPDSVDRRWRQPTALAIERKLQWVASRGVVSSVRRTISATSSSPIWRGAPGRGSSKRPSRRRSAKRRRHLPTVLGDAPRRVQMSLFSTPSAASKTIRARWARPCAVFRRAAKLPSSRRSLSVKSITTAVLPIVDPPPPRRESHIFADQDTRQQCARSGWNAGGEAQAGEVGASDLDFDRSAGIRRETRLSRGGGWCMAGCPDLRGRAVGGDDRAGRRKP